MFLSSTYELRSLFANILCGGIIVIWLFILLFVILILKGIWYLIPKAKIIGLVYIIIPVIISPIVFFMAVLGWRDCHVWELDCLIYQNQEDKIIVQYFETGITGNSNYRIITTSDNLEASFRRFELLDLSKLKNFSMLKQNPDKAIDIQIITKQIEYENRFFSLVKINDFR